MAQPGTPKRTRALRAQISGEKEEARGPKRARAATTSAVPVKLSPELKVELTRHGVPETQWRKIGEGLLQRWGTPRWSQILGLWTFLGDGEARPTSTSALQVWGPQGTGKTAIVSDYIDRCDLRHVWINCACFASQGELLARFVELLRREAVRLAPDAKELQTRLPPGRQIRSIDRMEASLKAPLEHLSQALAGKAKLVAVFDQAQEVQRLGAGVIDLLVSLPEVLQRGNLLSVVFISRLPLGSLGLPAAREPDAVAFPAYTEAEAGAVLQRTLASGAEAKSGAPAATSSCSSMLMKFAAPYVGTDMKLLKGIGLELASKGVAAGSSMQALKEHVEVAVDRRLGLSDLRGWLPAGHPASGGTLTAEAAATAAAVRQMTKSEKRLVVAAFLASHIEKEDDSQIFLNVAGRTRRKRRERPSDALPIEVRTPKPSSLARLLAIYHHLARQPQLMGPTLFEQLAGLKEAGMFRFIGDRSGVDQDTRVVCRAQLPLVRECARELRIDLCEYLIQS